MPYIDPSKVNFPKHKELVTCSITQPDGYQRGVWRIEAELSPQVKARFLGPPSLQFHLPEMAKRLCIPDKGYRNFLFSIFKDGAWSGDLRSNGIAEDDNPVTIDAYREAFVQSVTKAIDKSEVMI